MICSKNIFGHSWISQHVDDDAFRVEVLSSTIRKQEVAKRNTTGIEQG
jgi:hypothetical protein